MPLEEERRKREYKRERSGLPADIIEEQGPSRGARD